MENSNPNSANRSKFLILSIKSSLTKLKATLPKNLIQFYLNIVKKIYFLNFQGF